MSEEQQVPIKRTLVLSGGGVRGAFQAGVMAGMADRGARWDTIAGVSVGALNAAFVAQFKKHQQLEAVHALKRLWFEIKGNKSVYKRWFPFGKLHSLWKGGLYDTSPLKDLIRLKLDNLDLSQSNVNLMVGAVSLETGKYKYVTNKEVAIRSYVLASSAFPVAFPPVELEGQHWVDGGVRDITPITDALYGPDGEESDPDEIDVILSGPRYSESKMESKNAKNGVEVAFRTAGLMADEVFNSDLDRVPESQRNKIKIYSPPHGVDLPDPLSFDPRDIKRLYEIGYLIGVNNLFSRLW